MKDKRVLGVGAVVMGSVVGMLVAALVGVGVSKVLYGVRAQVKEEALPEDVVRGFYVWYLTSIDLQAGRNPLADRAYGSSELGSKDFVGDVDALLDSFGRGGYDPFLLAQDIPTGVKVGEAMVSGDSAYVRVETSFEDHALLVSLSRVDGAWRIDGVEQAPDGVVRSFYEGYLAFVANGGGTKRNPLVDGFYRDCPVLSGRSSLR